MKDRSAGLVTGDTAGVSAAGGAVEVASEPGRGAAFTVRLPLAPHSDREPYPAGPRREPSPAAAAAVRGDAAEAAPS